MKKSRLLASVVAACCVTSIASARDSAEREAFTAEARAHGVTSRGNPVQRIPLYERLESVRKNDAVADGLLKKFAKRRGFRMDNIESIVHTSDRYRVGNSGWALTVQGGGTKVRYRNHGYLDENPSIKKRARPTEAVARKLARDFIVKELAGEVKLGAHQDLVPWYTKYTHEAGSAADGSDEYDDSVETIVTFTRELGGVPVVGRGSKVEVSLANDGTVIGFNYDWEELMESNQDQDLVGGGEGLERASALVGQTPSKLRVPNHECGYFDAGFGYRDRYAPLQAACATWIVRTRPVTIEGSAEEVRSGIFVVTPMGTEIEYDSEIEKSHPSLKGKTGRPERPVGTGKPEKISFGPRNPRALEAIRSGKEQ